MCIYTVEKHFFYLKNSLWGCAIPPNVPKLGVSGVKDTAKNNTEFIYIFYISYIFYIFLKIILHG